jgi:hypothetical protein
MRAFNLATKFLLEIAALAAFGYFGYRVGGANLLLSIVLAIAVALIAAILWGFFAAPKSRYRLSDTPRLIFETCFFAAASAALALTGDRIGAIVLFVLYAINAVLRVRAG